MTIEGLPSDKRKQKRSRAFVKVNVQLDGRTIDARLRDLSEQGALLECDDPPEAGTAIRFRHGSADVEAQVVWVDGHRFGIEFERRLEAGEIQEQLGPALRVGAPRSYSGPETGDEDDPWSLPEGELPGERSH